MWTQMYGGKTDRVWYAEVLTFLRAPVRGNSGEVREHDFAWVQWYTSFGGPGPGTAGAGRRFHDPRLPSILTRRFPRVYLMERELGRSYDVIPVSEIIAPAPIHDDVSVADRTGRMLADEQLLQGSARSEFLKHNPYNVPLIQPRWNCNRWAEGYCQDPECTKLHEEQMRGADQARTRLLVVNLLVVQMSSGSLRPPWPV
jgi:hypothetical protein